MKKEQLIEELLNYECCMKNKYNNDLETNKEYYRGYCDALDMILCKLSYLEVKESLLKDIYANLIK